MATKTAKSLPSAVVKQTLRHRVAIAVPKLDSVQRKAWRIGAGFFACICLAACASAGPYNPDHLASIQIARLADICRTTMGLDPKESPVLGVYLGTPHLDAQVSHYQACIASLSDSLQRVSEANAAAEADQTCRARGFGSGSPDLAECVLQTVQKPKPSIDSSNVAIDDPRATQPTSVKSFFYISPHEARRREEMACARLGLEPPYGAFANCVKLINDNLYAIDNPIS